jgi:hypothetical protein
MNNLEDIGLFGKMSTVNMHCIQVLAKATSEHSVLCSVKSHDFIIHFIIHVADHTDSASLLELVLTSASSIDNLEAFQLWCMVSYKQWSHSYMTAQVMIPVCQSLRFQRLVISNVGLHDEQFLTITREVSNNKNTAQEELILN